MKHTFLALSFLSMLLISCGSEEKKEPKDVSDINQGERSPTVMMPEDPDPVTIDTIMTDTLPEELSSETLGDTEAAPQDPTDPSEDNAVVTTSQSGSDPIASNEAGDVEREPYPASSDLTPKGGDAAPQSPEVQPENPVVSTPPVKPEPPVATPPAKPEKPIFTHAIWDELLRKHVSSKGKVNYGGFLADKERLQEYLDLLSTNSPTGKSRNEQLAFWINAYNAFTVKLIIDNYLPSSIMNIDNGNTWKVKRVKIGSMTYSLSQIESDILVKQLGEPLVHFAINCAAKSCPPLWNRAYNSDNVRAMLAQRTREFINDPQFNTVKRRSADVSKIFEWYQADFGGDLKAFLNKYSAIEILESTEITFQEYDWSLNN